MAWNDYVTKSLETSPSCAIAHAKDSTPEPITAVIMCALAVHLSPVFVAHKREYVSIFPFLLHVSIMLIK